MRRITAVVVLLIVVLAIAVPAFGAPQGQEGNGSGKAASNSIYIVQMNDKPVVAYDGGVAGFAATKPASGQKINPNSAKVAKYAGYLKGTHDKALGQVGGSKVYSYVYSYNGFAAKLSELQAEQMSKVEGVLAVTRNELVTADIRERCAPDIAIGYGDPADEVLRLVRDHHADLVVLGIRPRSAIDLAVFGSTTQRVIRDGRCAVLTVSAREGS